MAIETEVSVFTPVLDEFHNKLFYLADING